MRLPKFEYLEPGTLKGAIKALASAPRRTVLLAGGTDLLVNMKHRLIQPERVIHLKAIPKLAYISTGRDGLRIGALTTLHDLISSPIIKENYPALCHAAEQVGAYTHQSMGTIGGNLCQGNRCRFYNQSAFWRSVKTSCYKAGGKICHVVRKPGECHSTNCGDIAPVLIAMDAKGKAIGPNGKRSFPLKRLYTGNGKTPLSLRKGEIMKEILIPPPLGKTIYSKWRLRGALEFPIVSLALRIEKGGDHQIRQARIVYSAVGSAPAEASETEKILKGASLDESTIQKALDKAVKEISPMRTSISSPAYKRKMAGILLRQALEEIAKAG